MHTRKSDVKIQSDGTLAPSVPEQLEFLYQFGLNLRSHQRPSQARRDRIRKIKRAQAWEAEIDERRHLIGKCDRPHKPHRLPSFTLNRKQNNSSPYLREHEKVTLFEQ